MKTPDQSHERSNETANVEANTAKNAPVPTAKGSLDPKYNPRTTKQPSPKHASKIITKNLQRVIGLVCQGCLWFSSFWLLLAACCNSIFFNQIAWISTIICLITNATALAITAHCAFSRFMRLKRKSSCEGRNSENGGSK